jgi:DNA-binding CsgD family transcriptional regulator
MICILQNATLTSREIEVCVLIRFGFDTQTIADRLCISYNTVRSHLRKIHISLQVKSRGQLIAYLNQLNEPKDNT